MARNTTLTVTANGNDISKYISPYLKTFSFTDSIESEADTAEITLADVEQQFLTAWFPDRGARLNVAINKNNWRNADTVDTLTLGNFELDESTYSFSKGGGSVIKIKLNSICNSYGIRFQKHYRSWENVRFEKICRDIANDAGLTLFYMTDNPEVKRAEQSYESDLAFLKKQCSSNGFLLKVNDGKLIICDAYTYESRDSILTLKRDDPRILSFDGRATVNQIYGDVNISYVSNEITNSLLGMLVGFLSGKTGLTLPNLTSLAHGAGDLVLEINRRIDNPAQAQRLAKKLLREKNKDEITCNLKIVGDFNFLAGNNITLSGFGFYDGKYCLDRTSHTIGQNGYTASLDLHKCLSY